MKAAGPSLPTDESHALVQRNHLVGLWQTALGDDRADSRVNELLRQVAHYYGPHGMQGLTLLQQQVLKRFVDANPLDGTRNIVLAGPTSSGKTTLGEVFLVRSALLNRKRSCGLYIAPTRALARMKHHELCTMLDGTALAQQVLLSTGEDNLDDWRIIHGQFNIACIVYEKANILFSHYLGLLKRLGCIVLDEFHLLSDYRRGPRLEMALLKALSLRREEEHRTDLVERLRILVNTTEDGLDAALNRFLTIGETTPLIFSTNERPIPIHHHLVMSADGKSVDKTHLVTFSQNQDRALTADRRTALQMKLSDWLQERSERLRRLASEKAEVAQARLLGLIMSILDSHPTGRRLLVFVPSRYQAEALAVKLVSQRKKRHKLTRRPPSWHQRLNALSEYADSGELAADLVKLARYSVFVHHSLVPKELRQIVEQIMGTPLEAHEASQVLFATETMSYGVNLAIHDVVFFGLKFPAEISPGFTVRSTLTRANFHNMAGRAGRLRTNPAAEQQKEPLESNVYLLLRENRADLATEILGYYSGTEAACSQLFATVRRKIAPATVLPVNPAAPSPPQAEPRARKRYSEGFIHAVLDSLRFVSLRQGNTPSYAALPAPFLDAKVVASLLGRSLYAQQNLYPGTPGRKRQRTRLLRGIERVLRASAQPELGLVEVEESAAAGSRYRVSQVGAALLDTGTEVLMIRPLLRLHERIRRCWELSNGRHAFPVELYLLCLLAQRCVHEPLIRYAYERRVTENSSDYMRELTTALSEPLRELGAQNAEVLAQTMLEEIRRHMHRTNLAGPGGRLPLMILRLFCAALLWVRGARHEQIDEALSGNDSDRSRRRARIQSFRAVMEHTRWRLIFLGRSMLTEPGGTISTIERRQALFTLAEQVRLGCVESAVPILTVAAGRVSRGEANRFVRQPEWSLDKLLTRTASVRTALGGLGHEEIVELYERYGVARLKELVLELSHSPNASERRHPLLRWVRRLPDEHFGIHARTFTSGSGVSTGFGEALLQAFADSIATIDGNPVLSGSLTLNGLPRQVQILCTARQQDCTVLLRLSSTCASPARGSNPAWPQELCLLGAQVASGWKISQTAEAWKELASVLAEQHTTRHLVIVLSPWLPPRLLLPRRAEDALMRRRDERKTTVLLSVPALAVLCAYLVRAPVTAEAFWQLLTSELRKHLFNFVGLREIWHGLLAVAPPLPFELAVRLARHFEVRPDTS